MLAVCLGPLDYLEALFAAPEVPGISVHYRIWKIRAARWHDILVMSEEQQKIQKYLIKSTPYGELNEVLKDL